MNIKNFSSDSYLLSFRKPRKFQIPLSNRLFAYAMRGHSLLWKSGLRGPSETVMLCSTLFLFIKTYQEQASSGIGMAINNPNDCLRVPIEKLPFSNEFMSFVNSLHCETLDEMLHINVSDLIKKPGFTYHVLQELVQFLEKKNLTNLLKQ